MIIFLTILSYLAAAVVDLMDKILVSKDKIRPLSYTFFTVVTGAIALLGWPWLFAPLPFKFVFIDLLSGCFFALAMYVFFKALSEGELTRVVPFIFSFVAVFDVLFSAATGRNVLRVSQAAAMFLLVPGALLLGYRQAGFPRRHIFTKLLSALCFSVYNWLWQYGAQAGPVANSFIWNRAGAAAILLLLLFIPAVRKEIFLVKKAGKKLTLSVLFIIKQILGGINFIFFSFLIALGNIVVIDSLQGLRYVFLFLFGLAISHKRKHFFEEQKGRFIFYQKAAAIFLIFLGTAIMFL